MKGLCGLLLCTRIAAFRAPLRASRTLRVAAADGTDAELIEKADLDDDAPRELPIDFGSSGTQWTFEWPAVDDEPWSVRDVAGGGAMFAACHIASGALGAPIAVRLAGTGAFLATQATLPLPKGVSPADVSDAFDVSQTIPVSKIGDTPWWGVALGASVPTIQIVLVPLLLSAPEGAFSCSASQLPNLADAAEKLAIAPLTEGLVFQFWALEACRRAGLPYAPSVLGAGLAFGAWHGLSPNSLFLAALGAYWGHLYAQTRNVLVPVSMHAVWNAFTLGVGACVGSGGG